MRSTPWPNDTLRTVKDARVPPRCIPMTTPSKIWMRSLSPSRTLTCTRTVSPDFMAGRSVSCGFSTSSIALIPYSFGALGDELAQNVLLFFVQLRLAQQLRPARQRAAQRLALAPAANLGVIARQQHVGHLQHRWAHRIGPGHLSRPRVLRKIEQPPAERILHYRLLVADHPRNEPRDRVQNHQRRQLAAAQDVVADRNLLGDARAHALVHPFVSTAKEHDMRQTAHALRLGLREPRPLRRGQDDGERPPALGFDGV